MANFGYVPKSTRWDADLELSELRAPAETFKLDPALPPIGQDPKFPSDRVVIAPGRLVSVGNTSALTGSSGSYAARAANSYEGETLMTLADGVTYKPVGYSPMAVFQKPSEFHQQWRPILAKNRYVQVPYINATDFSNSVFGHLNQGDRITAYPGYSGVTQVADPRHKGKIVKWCERRMYAEIEATPSGTVLLSNALYSCFAPSILAGVTTAGRTYSATASAYTAAGWTASFAADVALVLYEYGQGADMIAGQALAIEVLTSDMPGWLKWVGDNYGVWDMPRLKLPGYATSTSASGSSLTEIVAGAQYSLPHQAIATYASIAVYIADGCSYQTMNSNDYYAGTAWTTASGWTQLPAANTIHDPTVGQNWSIDPVNGILSVWGVAGTGGGAVTANDLRVVYSYENIAAGRRYDIGQMSITDGLNGPTYAGVPAQFDTPGSVGILRVMIE